MLLAVDLVVVLCLAVQFTLAAYYFYLLYWLAEAPPAGEAPALPAELPRVLVQIPIYNEPMVVERAVTAAGNLDWPRELLKIQLLDDSTDLTSDIAVHAIARVMIGLPDLIIADEPTSALDRVAGRIVVDQLKDLAMRAKCAVVLSTHDERIFDVATRRLHIEDGRCFEVPIHYH